MTPIIIIIYHLSLALFLIFCSLYFFFLRLFVCLNRKQKRGDDWIIIYKFNNMYKSVGCTCVLRSCLMFCRDEWDSASEYANNSSFISLCVFFLFCLIQVEYLWIVAEYMNMENNGQTRNSKIFQKSMSVCICPKCVTWIRMQWIAMT